MPELSAFDRALSLGALMGEEKNLVGMGIVAASALNRSASFAGGGYGFRSQSASLGDVFSAPHSASSMVGSVLSGNGLPRAGTQYSTTINANIPGASTAAYDAFEKGVKAALGYSNNLGTYADRYNKANVALDVAVKARDMGIDLGFGATNYGTRDFAKKAGVGTNAAKFGNHSIGPFDANEKAPKQSDFAARFAAAAALTGVSIPEAYHAEVYPGATPAQISAAASVMQRQAQDYMTQQMGQQVFPGMNYNDVVQAMPVSAVNVPDATGQLGIKPDALGFANHFGITPTNDYERVSLPDKVGQVDFAGYLDPPSPSPDYGDYANKSFTQPASAGFSMGQDQFNDIQNAGFPAPAPMSQDTFNDVWGAGVPSIDMSNYGPSPDMGISSIGPQGWADASGIDPHGLNAGYHAGVDGWGPTPDFNAASLPDRMQDQIAADRISTFEHGHLPGISYGNIDQLNASLMNELAPQPTQVASLGAVAPVTAGAPKAMPSTSLDMQAMYADDMQDKIGVPRGLPSMSVAPRQTIAAPPLSPPVSIQAPPRVAAPDLAPPSQPTAQSPYGGFGNVNDVMGAIGSGAAPMPGGINSAWGRTAFADSPYAGAAYNDVVDAAAKANGLPERRDILDGLVSDMGISPEMAGTLGGGLKGAVFGGLTGGPFGAAIGGLTGGVKGYASTPSKDFFNAMANPTYADAYKPGVVDSLPKDIRGPVRGAMNGAWAGGVPGMALGALDGYFGLTDKIGSFLGGMFSGNDGYGGSGMEGDRYSNERGFVDPGGWGLGNLGDSYGGFADGSAYGGGNGGWGNGPANNDAPQGIL